MNNTQFTIHIPAITAFNPSKAKAILQEETVKATRRILETLAAAARRMAPVDRGMLRASITVRVQPGTGSTLTHGEVRTGPQAPYAADVEYGTPPHWIEDITSLKGWARRVLGDEHAAYAVRLAIAKKGTQAQPFMAPAQMEVAPQVPILMEAAVALAVHRLENV